MKLRTVLAGSVALVVTAYCLQAADQTTKFFAKSGSKMRIEGTSNIHDWQAESPFIAGSLEVVPGFPTEPGQAATPGKIDAKAEIFVSVKSLKSLEKDGKPYSDKMDEVMWEHLKAQENPKISFRLNELTLRETAKSKDAPYVFEAKGDLTVAGKANQVTLPVNVLPLGDGKLKISGSTVVKMTSFGVEPPSPKFLPIKTGDDVKLIFDWMVAPRTAPAAAAAK